MSPPRVAVLMSVFNDARFIAAAIDSVLAQTYTAFELVIVIDGSTDGSDRIVRSYRDPRIRIIDNERNIGLVRSLNRGLGEIESEYVARLDADDIAFPERLEKQVAWLDAHPEVAALGVQAVPINDAGRRMRRVDWWYRDWQKPSTPAAFEWYRMFDNPIMHSGVVFRREVVVNDLGGYDVDFSLSEDAEMWMRVARRHAIANLDERLVAVRCHWASMTATTAATQNGHLDRMTSVTHAIMCDVLGDDVPRRWAQLWVGVKRTAMTMSAADVRELVDVLDQCAARFFELHPDAKDDLFIARHHVSLLARAIQCVITRDRRTARSIFARMRSRNAKASLLMLPRLAILFAFGEPAVRIMRRRRAAASVAAPCGTSVAKPVHPKDRVRALRR